MSTKLLLPSLSLLLAILLGGTVPTAATPPEPAPLANLNRQITSTERLTQSAQLEDRLLFITRDPQNDTRLWVSDLTTEGTTRLLASCEELCFDRFVIVATHDQRAFLSAVESATQVPQLLVTDGTAAGTQQLTELTSTDGLLLGSLGYWSDRLGRLLFAASDGGSGRELWSSDGTPEGTGLLLDIFPGEHSSSPDFFDVAETTFAVFFTATDEDGLELWRTDGTPEGTFQVRDVAPGPRFSFASHLTPVGDRVVFSAEDGIHGVELWSTDGSSGGTGLLLDSTLGPEGSLVQSWQATPEQVFFLLSDGVQDSLRHLVVTDGTVVATRVVATFEREETGDQPEPELVGALGSTAVLRIAGELWVSDGTSLGTRPLGCDSGPCPTSPQDFQTHGDGLVFRATDPVHGMELWTTDGTPSGTRLLADLCPGLCSSDPHVLASIGGRLYVRADDGVLAEELWSLVGSDAHRLTDFEDRHPFVTVLGRDGSVGSLANQLQFLAEDREHQTALWTADGSPEGTHPIRTVGQIDEAGSNPGGFVRLGPNVLFGAHSETRGFGLWRLGLRDGFLEQVAVLDSSSPLAVGTSRIRATAPVGPRVVVAEELPVFHGAEGHLWGTDGTTGGTRKLAAGFAFGRRSGRERTLPVLGSSVLFYHDDPPGLWVTDGTPQGTHLAREILVDGEEPAVTFRNRLWFRAYLDSGELELWTSDGMPDGTHPFADLAGPESSEPSLLTLFRGELYFVTTTGLWKTDGNAPPVEALPEVPLGRIDGMTVLGNRLLMSIDSNGSDASLWATDGTSAGTARIAPVTPRQGFHSEHPQQAGLAGFLFFVESRGGLWRTDGTPGGTFPVNLLPLDDREIEGIHAVPGRLLVVTREDTGTERLWLSAGTADGTEPLPKIEAAGRDFATVGSRVFFSGDDGRIGLEPWTFPLPQTGPPPPPPPTGPLAVPSHLLATGRRFGEVRLTWRDRSSNESSFVVQVRGSRLFSEFETVATLPAGTTVFTVGNLEPDRPYHFRVRAENGDGVSDWSPEAVATPVDVTGDCTLEVDLERVLCLQDGRFEVRVRWRHELGPSANDGDGQPTRFDVSDDSGTFWFFDQANVELVVKVLDARPVNGFLWVFYGALSDVEYWITVTDTQTETNVTYYNQAGKICGRGDVRAFPRPEAPGSNLSAGLFPADRTFRQAVPRVGAGSAEPCTPSAEDLCLSQNRYRVEVEWKDHRSSDAGRGSAIPGTADSGFFWFFDPANVELVVKVLDARAVNGHVWVFFGALTDVEYTVTVTDTQTGLAKSYHNEPENICGQADVRAF